MVKSLAPDQKEASSSSSKVIKVASSEGRREFGCVSDSVVPDAEMLKERRAETRAGLSGRGSRSADIFPFKDRQLSQICLYVCVCDAV